VPEYLTVKTEGVGEFTQKRSKFVGCCCEINSCAEAKAYIGVVKTRNKGARHNVFAYVLRDGFEKFSDDGEPQGTGGIQVLNVIRNSGLKNVIVVLSRYFGGVLLGTGGLSRAYRTTAEITLKNSHIIKKELCTKICLSLKHEKVGNVLNVFRSAKATITEVSYSEFADFEILVNNENAGGLIKELEKYGDTVVLKNVSDGGYCDLNTYEKKY
jgi:uncharacterized YigZ family protein